MHHSEKEFHFIRYGTGMGTLSVPAHRTWMCYLGQEIVAASLDHQLKTVVVVPRTFAV